MSKVSDFVSNEQDDVFVVSGLPEEVIAVLFARYSRSEATLREVLAEMIQEGAAFGPSVSHEDAGVEAAARRAAAFHERYVAGYGHSSVAEHANVHVAVENCSIVAAKALEERRLGVAITEKSTRYVRFDRSRFLRPIGLPAKLQAEYERSCERLMDTYQSLSDEIEGKLAERHGDVSKPARRAKALDLTRGLLPASSLTNVGLTGNARALAHAVRSMREEPLVECVRIGDAVQREASRVVPTLLKYTEPSPHRSGARGRILGAMRELNVRLPDPYPITVAAVKHGAPKVEFLGSDRATAHDLAFAVMRQVGADHGMSTGFGETQYAPNISEDTAVAIVEAYLEDRGPHDQPGRALETAEFTWRITCPYGAWRDLQRHRLVVASRPLLGTSVGFSCPDEVAEFGLAERYEEECARAAWVARRIAGHDEHLAQYATPLAFCVTYVLTANLRELFHLIELRTSSAGHPDYRCIAQDMATDVFEVFPWLRPHLRANFTPSYAFAREPRKP